MSEFTVNYQRPFLREVDKQKKNAAVKTQTYELILQTCMAAFLIISVTGNVILYTDTQSLQRENNKQIIQYDSLLSAKLLIDQELTYIKAQLQPQPQVENLIRILPVETGGQK